MKRAAVNGLREWKRTAWWCASSNFRIDFACTALQKRRKLRRIEATPGLPFGGWRRRGCVLRCNKVRFRAGIHPDVPPQRSLQAGRGDLILEMSNNDGEHIGDRSKKVWGGMGARRQIHNQRAPADPGYATIEQGKRGFFSSPGAHSLIERRHCPFEHGGGGFRRNLAAARARRGQRAANRQNQVEFVFVAPSAKHFFDQIALAGDMANSHNDC